ncbi:MAG: 6-phosphofructokinase [Sediminibacterium sp.]|nr:6-phosphofructokinase [Sediminibacterium sp.]
MKTKSIKSIGVLTSGGDSPGMNAAIRAVVRTGINFGLDMYGIYRGYNGLIEDEISKMDSKSVANIIQRGGTILKTARSKDFLTIEGRQKAYKNLKKHGIQGLVIIGGDGSFRGAQVFSKEFNIPVIGIPGTIDKDMSGTDYTIGFDTAVNTAVWAIDKIRDTADAHDRMFVVEVMGRDAGYIALYSGIATGAEHILIPESKTNMEKLVADFNKKEHRKKSFNLIVVAEGDEFGGANNVADYLKSHLDNLDIKVCILGHIQRGGSPSCFDRIIASRMGFHAVECLLFGYSNVMVGIVNNEMAFTPLDIAVIKEKHTISRDWFKVIKRLCK